MKRKQKETVTQAASSDANIYPSDANNSPFGRNAAEITTASILYNKPTKEQMENQLKTIKAFVDANGRISIQECMRLLNVKRDAAKYRLKHLIDEKQLVMIGTEGDRHAFYIAFKRLLQIEERLMGI
jgi:predicted HTH transcriptional regulator